MARRPAGLEVLLSSTLERPSRCPIMIRVFLGLRAGTLGALATLLATTVVGAQQPTFTPDHTDGIYAVGERI